MMPADEIHAEIAAKIDLELRADVADAIRNAVTVKDERIFSVLHQALMAKVLKNLAAREGFRLEVLL